MDDMKRNNVDIHTDNPCGTSPSLFMNLARVSLLCTEELNYHGALNDTSSKERGANYGYPDCFAAWDPSIIPNNQNIKVGTQFLIGTASGSLSDATCAQRYPPKLCFPAHTAPLGVKFKADGSAAYITFHGSWYDYSLPMHTAHPQHLLPIAPTSENIFADFVLGIATLPMAFALARLSSILRPACRPSLLRLSQRLSM